MLFRTIFFLLVLMILILAVAYFIQDKKKGKGNDPDFHYELVRDWLKLPSEFVLGNPEYFHFPSRWQKVALRPLPHTLIAEKTILLVDKNSGKIVNSWGDHLFIMPHGLTVDQQNNVWVTDVGLHQVFKFSHDGQLLMKLGEAKVPGEDALHFNGPTDVAVTSGGSFYISDGYGNNRIVKFAPDGKYLFAWGKKGSATGMFSIPHGLAIGEKGNLYVADRENSRVQVFDSSGTFLKQYAQGNFANITSVAFDNQNKTLIAIDDLSFLKIKHRGSDIFSFDSSGAVQFRFGRSGDYDGPVSWYHDIAIDNQQNIYVGDILGNKVQKFRRVLLR